VSFDTIATFVLALGIIDDPVARHRAKIRNAVCGRYRWIRRTLSANI